ncbi:hypothetical protein TNCV_2024591 [Trichonephila clavipes]|nr:hypothetical protein TNCV_2024591 [Trichonephila clavipes]
MNRNCSMTLLHEDLCQTFLNNLLQQLKSVFVSGNITVVTKTYFDVLLYRLWSCRLELVLLDPNSPRGNRILDVSSKKWNPVASLPSSLENLRYPFHSPVELCRVPVFEL